MKRITSLILIMVILVSTTISVNAAYTTKDNSSYFSEVEAANIALLFIYNSIDMSEGVWSEETIIDTVYELYDLDHTICGYTFCLNTNGTYSGYITISTEQNCMPVQEFSYVDKPLFEENISNETKVESKLSFQKHQKRNSNKEKILYNGALEYYVEDSGVLYDLDKKEINIKPERKERNNDQKIIQHNKELKEIVSETYMGSNYAGQLGGYAISNQFQYMADRYGSYTYVSGRNLSSFVGLDMDDYGGDNDCTLVSITAIANYYKSSYSNIPSSINGIYSDVLNVARNHGYVVNNPIDPFVIDDVAKAVFQLWGYNFAVNTVYSWSLNTFKNQLNAPNSNPLLFNIGSGYYSNHTVCVFGYASYNVADFLLVKDNWSTATRYIHLQQGPTIGSVTTIEG